MGNAGQRICKSGPGLALMVVVVLLAACAEPQSPQTDEYLLRIGESKVAASDFSKAMESAKAAYPHALLQDPALLKAIQRRILKELTEKLIFRERAKELGIHISDAEVENAAARIKEDYPGKTFEQTLLENAVSYSDWRAGLEERLLMERVVDRDIKDHIVITPDEIETYFEAHHEELASPDGEPVDGANEMIVRNLRRQKAEQAYTEWMKGLQARYRIEINKTLLDRLTGP
jgi:hypothetical protein